MDSNGLAEIFPGLIANYLEDATGPEQVQPDPLHRAHPSWSFTTTGEILTVGALFHDSEQLRVTLGLAIDVPYDPQVSHVVNHLNNKELVYGRMFLIGNEDSGRGCILMQEIFAAQSISEEFPPSLQNLLMVIGAMGGQASRLAPKAARAVRRARVQRRGSLLPADERLETRARSTSYHESYLTS